MGAQYGVRSDPIERAASPLRLLAVLADDVVVGPATRLAASTVQFVREASRGSEESSNERRTSQWAAQEVRQGRWPLQQPLLHTAPAVANVHAVSNAFAQVMKTASRVGASVRRNPFTAPSAAPSAAPSTPTRLHLHSAFGFSERAPRRVPARARAGVARRRRRARLLAGVHLPAALHAVALPAAPVALRTLRPSGHLDRMPLGLHLRGEGADARAGRLTRSVRGGAQ